MHLTLAVLTGFALIASSLLARAATNTPPNVLFFFMDDLRPELGCYGDKLVKSPNIDRLAARSVLFERAYCQQAVCAPSRASVMSGLRPDSTGIYDLGHPLRRTKPDVVSLPQWFKEHGYVTARFGKVYHHENDDEAFWNEMPKRGGKEYNSAETLAAIEKLNQAAKAKGLKGLQLYTATRGPSLEAADVPDTAYPDGITAEQAIESLRRNRTNAFFMCVGFTKPHLPFCAPKKYWDLYQRDEFPVPGRAKPEGVPDIALTGWGELRSYSDVRGFRGDLDDDKTQEMIHGYHAAVSFSDAQVGKVLDELDKLGLADNTIIVLWGDHGWKLGDYGMWCKHTNFEIDTRVPLMVSAPGKVQGKHAAGLVEMVDVFPTLTELCGGDAPRQCEGKSLVAMLRDPTTKGHEFAVSQYPREQERVMGYTIRNDRWRYTEWVDLQKKEIVARELYDQSGTLTPGQNLVNEAEHAKRVEELAAKLKPYEQAKFVPRSQRTPGVQALE